MRSNFRHLLVVSCFPLLFRYCYAQVQPDADVIIVGAGPAGLVLANRLSENSSRTIIVLEAGPDPTFEPDINIPALVGGAYSNTRYAWNFTSTPQATLNGRAPDLPQGHTLGGGAAINFMQYCRGSQSVYDEWATITGDDGWRFENMLTYFRRSTQLESVTTTEPVVSNATVYDDGPIRLSYEREPLNFTPYFLDAFRETLENPCQLVSLTDGHGIGCTPSLNSIRVSNQTRSYALPAFGYPVGQRKNVRTMTDAWVMIIGFDGHSAKNVTYVSASDNSAHTLTAKEIILSAGAINTPKLLMLSGVGPKDHLNDLGIPLILDVADVGNNLYDHHLSSVVIRVQDNITTTQKWTDPEYFARLLAEYMTNHTGSLTNPPTNGIVAERIPDEYLQAHNSTFQLQLPKDRPHLYYSFATSPWFQVPPNINALTVFVALIQPEVAGYMRLKSNNFRDNPLLYSNYYGSPSDMTTILYGYKRLRRMMRSEAVAPIFIDELFPGTNVTSDTDVLDALKAGAATFDHPLGTMSLGKVVDNSFRVKGLQNLRVVDSSIIPVMPTCPTQGAVYALAERAADILKGQL